MSKVDALRAMREARFASYQAKPAAARPAAEKPAAATTAAPAKAAPRAKAKKVETVDLPATDGAADGTTDAAGPAAALCGHRNMSGKECSRPAGHAEKNHRYR